MTKLNIAFKYLISFIRLFKTDFRITIGILFITSGICLLNPTLLSQFLNTVFNIYPEIGVGNDKHLDFLHGIFFVSTGIQYHLLYIAHKAKNRLAELLIVTYVILMLTASVIYVALYQFIL